MSEYTRNMVESYEKDRKVTSSCLKSMITDCRKQEKTKICYKNVIIFKKGIAICKQVCYNTVTYKR